VLKSIDSFRWILRILGRVESTSSDPVHLLSMIAFHGCNALYFWLWAKSYRPKQKQTFICKHISQKITRSI